MASHLQGTQIAAHKQIWQVHTNCSSGGWQWHCKAIGPLYHSLINKQLPATGLGHSCKAPGLPAIGFQAKVGENYVTEGFGCPVGNKVISSNIKRVMQQLNHLSCFGSINPLSALPIVSAGVLVMKFSTLSILFSYHFWANNL